MENGPEYYDLHFLGAKIGSITFVGIPGEPFAEIGVALKEIPGGYDLPHDKHEWKRGRFPIPFRL